MGLVALILYGVGDILGAGNYGLIGKSAGLMGNAVWVAFAVGFVAAGLTALSYASLGSRHPKAAGAAFVAQRAFGRSWLSYLVGMVVTVSGMLSMAVQARAFTGYFSGMFGFAPPGAGLANAAPGLLWFGVIAAFVGALTLVNWWGIKLSARFTVVCTVIEAAGLIFIIAVSLPYWGAVDYLEVPSPAAGVAGALTLALVLQGAALTFYSFLGFEDMINVAEEVRDAERNFPIGVVTAIGIAAVVYMAVAIGAVSVVPYGALGASGQPLVDVAARGAPWFPSWAFSFVAMFAIANTALVNFIMGSRVLYGMGRMGMLPGGFDKLHPVRRTPVLAIYVLAALVIVLALSGDIRQLATATSILLLCTFIVINAALIVLQRRAGEAQGFFEVPLVVPLGGIATSAAILFNAEAAAWRLAAVLIVVIVGVYLVVRPKAPADA